MLRVALVLLFAFALAAGQNAKPADKAFIDCDPAELLRAVPDLAGTKFDPSQDGLDALLSTTEEKLAAMLARLVDLSAAEQIHEMRFEAGMGEGSRREDFRYLLRMAPDAALDQFTELRVDPKSMSPAPPSDGQFLVMGQFFKLLFYLLPQFREQSSFRYVGRSTVDGQDLFVVAFAEPRSHMQGLVWIDAATYRIVRLRAQPLERVPSSQLETVTTDVTLVPVTFESLGTAFWLPATVTVHARYAGGELHSVHRYSDYRLEGGGATNAEHAGVGAAIAPAPEDAWELLDRGIALARENKPGEAIATLRDALRRNPQMPAARFHLAAALRDTGDYAGAETEVREALKLVPDSGPVHNFLGILLFKRGDMPGAIAELHASAQLQPQDAIVHYNLAQAIEKTGDRKAALEEYRTASTLAPDNARFKTRYEQLARAAEGTTIKVEVRQVLVPVVVTDKQGHHVTGLTQADFHVFEDGVEQKISGFSVENAGVRSPEPSAAPVSESPAEAPAPAAATPKPVPVRRTYLICIDAFHTDFANLVHVREALSKLFRTEQAGDAQYVVVSVGLTIQVMQNTTSDPQVVLQAIDRKDFQKLFLGSRKSSAGGDLQSFRRELDEARAACDAGQPECPGLKRMVAAEAGRIAQQDDFNTRTFLHQLRGLVEQLRQGTGRRTIVLFSDGFVLVPGQIEYQLLAAYFPEMREASLRAVERLPDLDPVLRLAANSNIPIYTIDSRGLYTSPYYDASNAGGVSRLAPAVLGIMDQTAADAGQTLLEIAAATGGTAFHNSNDIFGGLQRAFADGRQYYMLAYVPSNSASDGKFRAISVRLRDTKLVVNAKRGYWATSQEPNSP